MKQTDTGKKLGTILKKLRKEKDLTQADVAEKLDITINAYGAYETGNALPPIEKLLKLCELFLVSPNVLLGYEKSDTINKFCKKYNLENSNLDNGKTKVKFPNKEIIIPTEKLVSAINGFDKFLNEMQDRKQSELAIFENRILLWAIGEREAERQIFASNLANNKIDMEIKVYGKTTKKTENGKNVINTYEKMDGEK